MFRRVISKPWPRVSTIAIAMHASTERITPSRHSVSIIDSSTPSSAIIEPTESSMPPVMITRPRPMLKIPNAPICRARFWRLIGSRKFGLMTETMMQRTISRTKMPSSFFISSPLILFSHKRHKNHKPKTKRISSGRSGPTSQVYICVFCAFLWLSFGAGGETHDGLFAELRASENSGEPSFVHHCDAIADPKHLFHLTTDHDHRHAFRRKTADELIDLRFGADVDSTCRLVEDQHSRRKRQPLRQHYFLLVAATQVRGTHLGRRRLDID